LTDQSTATFLRVIDSTDNSTGGGSASAIAGSMAAALAAMVARLSSPAAGGESEATYDEIAQAGTVLSQALLAGAHEDAASFDAVVAAYRLPKETAEEKEARRAAIQEAMIHATRVPLDNAERCTAVQSLVARLEGRSNPRALSDLQSAGHLARAGLLGCLANVDINLPGIKDAAAAAEIRKRADALRGG
jgi:formiminotetrahydrofolate cyclodeaminase